MDVQATGSLPRAEYQHDQYLEIVLRPAELLNFSGNRFRIKSLTPPKRKKRTAANKAVLARALKNNTLCKRETKRCQAHQFTAGGPPSGTWRKRSCRSPSQH